MAKELQARPRVGVQALYNQNHESRRWPGGNKEGLLRPQLICDWMRKQTEVGDLPGGKGQSACSCSRKRKTMRYFSQNANCQSL